MKKGRHKDDPSSPLCHQCLHHIFWQECVHDVVDNQPVSLFRQSLLIQIEARASDEPSVAFLEILTVNPVTRLWHVPAADVVKQYFAIANVNCVNGIAVVRGKGNFVSEHFVLSFSF